MSIAEKGTALITIAVAVASASLLAILFATAESTKQEDRQPVATADPVAAPKKIEKKKTTSGEIEDARPWHDGKLTITFSKSEGLLKIFRDGKLVKWVVAIAGGNKADKKMEGDKATPEGTFYVCAKNPQSKYTRSLGLSYPNREDAERGFQEGLIGQEEYDNILWAIRAGRRPPWKTKLGGEIFIHGARRTRTSTLGCISISDKEILEIFPHIERGTTVTITR